MATLLNSFETGTAGAAITTGNSGGGGSAAFDSVFTGFATTITYDTARAANGAQSCKLTTPSDAATVYCQWDASLGATAAQMWFRASYYFTAYPSSPHGLVRYMTSAGGSQCARLALQATGHLVFDDAANTTQITSTGTVPLSSWWRLEGYCTGSASTGQLEFKVYSSPAATVPSETQTSGASLNTMGGLGAIQFGVVGNASQNETWWQDDIGASTTGYIGTVTATSAPPFLSQFNGMF